MSSGVRSLDWCNAGLKYLMASGASSFGVPMTAKLQLQLPPLGCGSRGHCLLVFALAKLYGSHIKNIEKCIFISSQAEQWGSGSRFHLPWNREQGAANMRWQNDTKSFFSTRVPPVALLFLVWRDATLLTWSDIFTNTKKRKWKGGKEGSHKTKAHQVQVPIHSSIPIPIPIPTSVLSCPCFLLFLLNVFNIHDQAKVSDFVSIVSSKSKSSNADRTTCCVSYLRLFSVHGSPMEMSRCVFLVSLYTRGHLWGIPIYFGILVHLGFIC